MLYITFRADLSKNINEIMSHIGLALQQLFITLRTKPKFLAVTYKALPDLAPSYLSDLVLFLLAHYVSATESFSVPPRSVISAQTLGHFSA